MTRYKKGWYTAAFVQILSSMTDESQKKSIGTCKRIFQGNEMILNEDL